MSINLIDAYISEVGRRLPRQTRADIEAEIRSILQDMLEERSQKTGKPVNDEMIVEVLKAYGSPEKVATTYMGERYLIGPRLYPIFTLVLRIVVMVVGIFAAIGMGIALYQASLTSVSAIEAALKAIADFITTVLIAMGNVVLIFAIIEWALYRAGEKLDTKSLPREKEWDPRTLANVTPANRIKIGEAITEIVGSFVAIILFNFYPEVIGISTGVSGTPGTGGWAIGFGSSMTFTPILSEAFFHFVPYLTLVWALNIILNLVLLRMGHWNVYTRLSLIGLKIVNIVIAVVMLGVPSLLAVTTASLTEILGSAEAACVLMNGLGIMIRVLLWLAIFGNGVTIIRKVFRLSGSEKVSYYMPESRSCLKNG